MVGEDCVNEAARTGGTTFAGEACQAQGRSWQSSRPCSFGDDRQRTWWTICWNSGDAWDVGGCTGSDVPRGNVDRSHHRTRSYEGTHRLGRNNLQNNESPRTVSSTLQAFPAIELFRRRGWERPASSDRMRRLCEKKKKINTRCRVENLVVLTR